MRIKVDPRVKPGLMIFLCLAGIFALTSQELLLLAVLVIIACQIAFFRDPERNVPAGDLPVSPADGTVTDITECREERFLNEEAVKIGIFLSIFNVHVTRSPVAGAVKFQKYEPGKFINALRSDSAEKNESNWIGFDSGERKTLIRQISGAIARKIFWDVKTGQGVEKGEKVGIICYGSRTEFYAPKRFFKTHLRLGDKVKAGETILGEWLQ